MWGTPRASEWKGAGNGVTETAKVWNDKHYLTGQVQVAVGLDGHRLNPEFAERLMGYPTGWMVLEEE